MTDDSILRLADLPRPAGEQHEMDPPHDLCLGDDPCICIHLAACEKRVRDEERAWEGAVVVARAGYEDGYAAGLDAAREAVCKCVIVMGVMTTQQVIWSSDALAAIDALKEKP